MSGRNEEVKLTIKMHPQRTVCPSSSSQQRTQRTDEICPKEKKLKDKRETTRGLIILFELWGIKTAAM